MLAGDFSRASRCILRDARRQPSPAVPNATSLAPTSGL